MCSSAKKPFKTIDVVASEKKSIHLNLYECMENYTHTYTHPTVKNGIVKIVVRVMMRWDVEGGEVLPKIHFTAR